MFYVAREKSVTQKSTQLDQYTHSLQLVSIATRSINMDW